MNFKIDTGAFKLLKHIRTHKIEFLHMLCKHQWNFYLDEDFGSFLKTCTQLKHLTLKNAYSDAIMEIKSQLETFEVINVKKIPSSFLYFLEAQKSSLKNLTLDAKKFKTRIANFVYFEMSLDKLVDYREKHEGLEEVKNVTVKNLAIKGESDNFEYFKKIFPCFEMLEVLSVKLPAKQQLEFLRLLSTLPKLKYLKLDREKSTEELKPTFKFNRLEHSILSRHFTVDQYVDIIRCCPNLTHLKIDKSWILQWTKNDFERIFEVCKNVKEITLSLVNQTITDEIFETLKNAALKFNLKVEAIGKDNIEKLKNAKNRLTVFSRKYQNRDPFAAFPNILSNKFYDDNNINYANYSDHRLFRKGRFCLCRSVR